MNTEQVKTTTSELEENWLKLKAEHPEIRNFNAAKKLGITELELLNLSKNIKFLNPDSLNFWKEISELGKLSVVTRNEEAIQEYSGKYPPLAEETDEILNFKNDSFSIKFQQNRIEFVLSTEEEDEKSLQFFDKNGKAVHKIYSRNVDGELDDFIKKHKIKKQKFKNPETILQKSENKLNDAKKTEFEEAWKNMEEPQDLSEILERFNLCYLQALQTLSDKFFACKVRNRKIITMLEEVQELEMPVKAITSNGAVEQAYNGEIKNTFWHHAWFNAGNNHFSLRFDASKISETWLVRKPTSLGILTSIETFDFDGNPMIQFFGQTDEDRPEPNEWRKLLVLFEN